MNSIDRWLEICLIVAGAGQLLLAAGSLAIPRILDWNRELARLGVLTRRLFWVYAAYILATNVSLGLLSVAAARPLMDGSLLATAVCLFAFLYWGARLLIQFTLFHGAPEVTGAGFHIAETALVSLFVFLTVAYGWAAAFNMWAEMT